MAFEQTGGGGSSTSSTRPIDLAHLSRQTMGDRALEEEVLALFAHQIAATRGQIAETTANEERYRLAHTLKGAARGMGAFTLADCAEKIERDPSNKDLVGQLSSLIDEVQDFIATISR